MTRRSRCLLLLALAGPAHAQTSDLRAAIGQLGDFDYMRRMNAARAVRRAPGGDAVPALVEAVTSHRDEFVRARAFVLLTGFNDPRTAELARTALSDRNDRLREAALDWFAHHPDPALIQPFIAALETESAEFVRPALIRALVALDNDANVRARLVREIGRGLDIFRGALIEALAERRATYAIDAIGAVALIDGPLQDDAVRALGRIRDPRALAALGRIDGQSGSLKLTIAAAACVIQRDCTAERGQLVQELGAEGERARAAAEALAMMADAGDDDALGVLLAAAENPKVSPEAVALAVASSALRQPARMLDWLAATPALRDRAVLVLRDGFDMLEEDLAEESFFAAARATYWKSAEPSDMRTVTATLIDKLEF